MLRVLALLMVVLLIPVPAMRSVRVLRQAISMRLATFQSFHSHHQYRVASCAAVEYLAGGCMLKKPVHHMVDVFALIARGESLELDSLVGLFDSMVKPF